MATVAEQVGLPSLEEYEAAGYELAELLDVGGSVHDVAERLFQAINYEGEQKVTYADVGMLLVFVDELRDRAAEVKSLAKRLERVALADLTSIVREGRQPNIPSFDEHGMEGLMAPRPARRLADDVREHEGAHDA